MNTKKPFSLLWIVGALGAVVMLIGAAAHGWAAVGGNSAPAAQSELISLESTYAGSAKLNWASPGVYSDTLTAPTGTLPDLGSIDLGFLLHCSQNSLSGYVDLGTTLVFTTEHVITTTQAITTPLAVGPAVHGTCNSADLQFESERFSMVTEAGQRVMRQFRLTGVQTGTVIAGEYRETLWGYGPQPLTVVGAVEVALVSGTNVALSNRVYLPLIRR